MTSMHGASRSSGLRIGSARLARALAAAVALSRPALAGPVLAATLALAGPALAAPLPAQDPPAGLRPDQLRGIQDRTAVVTAGPQYAATPVQEFFLGEGYREVWTTPVRVPYLDLGAYAGGLTPLEQGGNQSRTLHFRGADGRRYIFRTVDKYLAESIPEEIGDAPVGRLVQDQTAAFFPAAGLVIEPLQGAVGVLNAPAIMVLMPDDSRLGEFREEFAGLLGTIEERPDEIETESGGTLPGYAGSDRVVAWERMMERLEESPEDRIDAREYLAGRLLDFIVGDPDRGIDQLRWARFGEPGNYTFRPVPRDRDYAFQKSGGVLVKAIALAGYDKLVTYGPEHSPLSGYIFMTRDLDRELLVGVPKPAWDSTVAAVQAALDDATIARAVAQLPPPWRALRGDFLASSMRARRDSLPGVANAFYEFVARYADVFATDQPEYAEVDRLDDGTVRVRVYWRPELVAAAPPTPDDQEENRNEEEDDEDDDGRPVIYSTARIGVPYFDRTFLPAETREIRLYMRGGGDHVVVRGAPRRSIPVRVIGGGGDDVLVDSSYVADGTWTALYDHRGDNHFVTGPETRMSTRPWEPPKRVGWLERKLKPAPIDFGTKTAILPYVDYGDGAGLVLGAGPTFTRRGFRRDPYKYRIATRALISTRTGGLAAEVDGDYRLENSSWGFSLEARASQFESIRFYGFGNDTPELDSDLTLARYNELFLAPAVDWRPSRTATYSAGPILRYVDLRPRARSPLALQRPLGAESFGEIGAFVRAEIDRPGPGPVPERGFTVSATASAYPGIWDAPDAFGRFDALATAYAPFPFSFPRDASLAFRLGGQRVWGDFPVHEAAFIGGHRTLRGYRHDRFAGDAALYGGTELRAPIGQVTLLVKGDLGGILLVDAGRVFFDGDSDGGWHTGVGAGLWFTALDRIISLTYAHGEVGKLYLRLSLPY